MNFHNHRLSGQLSVAVPPEETDFWSSLKGFPEDVAIYAVDLNESNDLRIVDCGNGDHRRDPIFFALSCVDPSNAPALDALKNNPDLRNYFGNSIVSPIRGREPRAVLAGVLKCLSDYVAPLTHFASEQVLALSTTRQEYERLHLRFSALESYIQRAGISLVRERCFVEADLAAGGKLITAEGSETPYRQILPVASKGLCALDILIRFINAPADASVSVRLFLGDAGTPAAEWMISAQQAADSGDGWYSLAMSRAIEGISKSAILEIACVGLDPSQVAFGLSKLVANPDYCLKDATTGTAVVNRALAIRIWEAPPGILVPAGRNVQLSPARAKAPQGPRRLPGPSLTRIRPVYLNGWVPDFDAVSYMAHEDHILVHPPASGPCAGVIDRAVPRASASVSATAFIAHSSAKPVEFALAVLDPELDEDEPWQECPHFSNVVAWSGWRGVAPGQQHQLTVPLSPEDDGGASALSLILMTRMEGDAPNSFAWARFKDILIEELD
jgi:hypothetical protein